VSVLVVATLRLSPRRPLFMALTAFAGLMLALTSLAASAGCGLAAATPA
jgi:hypothetical protein